MAKEKRDDIGLHQEAAKRQDSDRSFSAAKAEGGQAFLGTVECGEKWGGSTLPWTAKSRQL